MSIDEIIHCKYICTFGLIKLCNEENNIVKIDNNLNIVHDFSNVENIKEGSCITIICGEIAGFIKNILPRITKKFILFTIFSDSTMPVDFMDESTFIKAIENPYIINWYSTNCLEYLHKKLILVPLGMNIHCSTTTSSPNSKIWHDTVLTPLQQEEILDEIHNNSKPFYEREIKCYSNFHFNHYPNFGNPRIRAIRDIPKEVVFYEPTYLKRINTWENQSKYAFVLSPLGHGLDCHRTWEALVLGCIVIVETSPLDSLYNDLPVLIVNNWSDINQELLQKTVEDFKNRKFDYNKITLKYWHDFITKNKSLKNI